MKLFDTILQRIKPTVPLLDEQKEIEGIKEENKALTQKLQRKSYEAAVASRLTNSWITSNTTADRTIRFSLAAIRARSRDLAINNDYVRKFLRLLAVNIVGESGVMLQAKSQDPNGKSDSIANTTIETSWKYWGKKGQCDVTESLSWVDIQSLVIQTVARDGEIFIRMVNGYSNKSRFAVQLIEADCININHNANLSNGNRIKMGVELDKWEKPVAYHFRKFDDLSSDYSVNPEYERIPAQDVIHLFVRERITQNRGVPWLASAMLRLKHLDEYEEAEIVAARVAASKMGFFTTPGGDQYTGDDVDDKGNFLRDVEPGGFEELPAGFDVKTVDWDHPNQSFGSFVKSTLRGISVGLGVSYNSLASDLESTSYSSLRQGALEDRDAYKLLQNWFISSFITPLFEKWLVIVLVAGETKLPFSKLEKFKNVTWYPKRWQWIDPQKDMTANVLGIKSVLKTRTDVLADQGLDFEEVCIQLKKEKELLEEYGILNEETTS